MYRLHVSVVIRQNGRVLFLQEADEDYGLWNLPGGHVEPDETVKQAALREAKEETGLSIVVTDLIGVYPGFGDKPRTAIRFVFAAQRTETAEQESPGEDILALKWMSDEELSVLSDRQLVSPIALRHIIGTRNFYSLSAVVEERL